MAFTHRPACAGLGAVALLLVAACTSSPQMGIAQARAQIDEQLPELLEVAVGDRRSVPTERVILDCAAGPGQRRAERHARVTALQLDDDPDAIAEAVREHLEEQGAEITELQLLPQDPRVEAEVDEIRYIVLVDTESGRVMAAGTTACYSPDEMAGP